jgi:GT2 family glycosyltransferase
MTPSTSAAPVVTVIVVSYNTRELVRRCVTSVLKETDPPLHVIVVDNASADGTAEMVRRDFPSVTLIANRDNRGFAAANNQGMAVARGRYVLLLNPDTEVFEGALAATARFADEHPDAAVVGCKVVGTDGHRQNTIFRTKRVGELMINALLPNKLMRRSRLFGRSRYADLDRDAVQDVETVAGCFMFVRREAIERVGVMDEDFFIYGEESEWCFRFRRAGLKVKYFPGASILHHGGRSTSLVSVPMNLAMARSNLLLLQKTRGRAAAWFGNLFMLLRDLPRAVVHLVFRTFGIRVGPRLANVLQRAAARVPLNLRGLFRTDWRSEARRPPLSSSPAASPRAARAETEAKGA